MIYQDILIHMTCQPLTEPSPILFSVERRINVLNMWQRQLYFQSSLLSLDLFAFLSLSFPSSLVASCCSALFQLQKKLGRCDKSGLTSKSPQPDKGFPLDRFLTRWLSMNPKIGLLFFLSFFFLATAG